LATIFADSTQAMNPGHRLAIVVGLGIGIAIFVLGKSLVRLSMFWFPFPYILNAPFAVQTISEVP